MLSYYLKHELRKRGYRVCYLFHFNDSRGFRDFLANEQDPAVSGRLRRIRILSIVFFVAAIPLLLLVVTLGSRSS